MADQGSKRVGIGVAVGLVALAVGWRVCSKSEAQKTTSSDATSVKAGPAGSANDVPAGLTAPIAAAHLENGEVLVAALDTAAKAIRVRRIDAKDAVVAERVVLEDVAWSSDSELKIAARANEGAAVTWRGLRGGKLVRQVVVFGLDHDLPLKGEPTEVAAASCATREAVWFSDGTRAVARAFRGAASTVELPQDKDVSLLCGASHAFAVLDDDDRTSLLPLVANAGRALTIVRESDFGDDEQRELAEYTVGDDIGFVRLGGSGAVAIREVEGGTVSPLRKLKTAIPKDDDVVAVDASSRVLAIVYTQDTSSACPPGQAGETTVATKVSVLRVDRRTFEESTVDLAPGRCGHEVGPFFTGVLGDRVAVAWTERAGGAGQARSPIVGLAHALVGVEGAPVFGRIEQPAEALVDAGCDASSCQAVALTRNAGASTLKVLRYK
jgi:hypothetical protein